MQDVVIRLLFVPRYIRVDIICMWLILPVSGLTLSAYVQKWF